MAKETIRLLAIVFSGIFFSASIAVGVLPCAAQSPSSQQEPLGDVARDLQQQQAPAQEQDHTPKEKATPHPKVYHNKDVVSNAAEDKETNASSPSGSPSGDSANANGMTGKTSVAGTKPAQDEQQIEDLKPQNSRAGVGSLPARSVYDRPDDSATDVVIVPAGTEIHVNILDGNVALPVRLGFSTPIPALSKVTVKLFGVNDNESYWEYFGISDYASLTSVTIGNVAYPVQTNTVPYFEGEEVFTLSAPLTIKR